jgi:periplasmic divalent cation tolerance protein
MSEGNAVVVFITTSSEDEARKIADLLLVRHKAACVNIVPRVDSMFWWEGKLDSTQESLLIIKTKSSVLPQVIDLVKQAHSYTVPEVIALPIIGGNEDYLKWIDEEVRER